MSELSGAVKKFTPMFSSPLQQPDLLNIFIQKQDSVTIPPLSGPQLQNAAFSVIEATKSQLSELKLADLFAQQLPSDRSAQFISEFLYHWAGVDSKPPESMVESSKASLHTLIRDFLASHDVPTATLSELICPVLPCLTSVADVEELSACLSRSIYVAASPAEDGASLAHFEAFGADAEPRDAIESLEAQKLRDIRRAFSVCLSHPEERFRMSTVSTTRAVVGSESATQGPDSEDGDGQRFHGTDSEAPFESQEEPEREPEPAEKPANE
jgi:hypothetical protein